MLVLVYAVNAAEAHLYPLSTPFLVTETRPVDILNTSTVTAFRIHMYRGRARPRTRATSIASGPRTAAGIRMLVPRTMCVHQRTARLATDSNPRSGRQQPRGCRLVLRGGCSPDTRYTRVRPSLVLLVLGAKKGMERRLFVGNTHREELPGHHSVHNCAQWVTQQNLRADRPVKPAKV